MQPASTDLGQYLCFALSCAPFLMSQLAAEALPSASQVLSELEILAKVFALAHLQTPFF